MHFFNALKCTTYAERNGFMTDYEKEQIYKLRAEGIGYKAISSLLGLNRDAVRSFCKRNRLNGEAKLVSLNIEEQKKRHHICEYCNKPLKQKKTGRVRKFCSDECRRKWWNKNQDKRNKSEEAIYKYICVKCGKEFICYGDKKRKYCSHNCYIKFRFWGEGNGI